MKRTDFLGRLDKLAADAKAAATTIKDETSLKTDWPKVGGLSSYVEIVLEEHIARTSRT